MQNLITDVPGLLVGHAQDLAIASGVTVIVFDTPTAASVAIHGGGPAVRDTALLEPQASVETVDAIVLSGGSAFGLDAAGGVMAHLAGIGRGFQVGDVRVPIVPGASVFDLAVGGGAWWPSPPWWELGFQAAASAASSFALEKNGEYDLNRSHAGKMSSSRLIALAGDWIEKYPIVLWEDPLAENDWEGFKQFTAEYGERLEVVGDDIFVTNTKYIAKGIKECTANSALIKLNQIGTVSESIEAVRMCRDSGWRYFLSHRSGETEDTFLADFAVAMDGGHLKAGSASRSERIAKYNRLLEIEEELGEGALYYW